MDLSWARSAGPFEGWLRGAIVQLKYHGEWSRCRHLAEIFAPVTADMRIDILVPVPLHSSRLKQRGFNQSLVLAHELAQLIDATVDDCLVRKRRTPSQTTLDAAARRSNVTGAFELATGRDYSGLTLAIIDDVMTTGSTIGECARTLQPLGAASIGVVTLARELS